MVRPSPPSLAKVRHDSPRFEYNRSGSLRFAKVPLRLVEDRCGTLRFASVLVG